MDCWPIDATARAAASAGALAEEPVVPEIAVFGEWNTLDLGNRAIHAEVKRFFEECGWRTRSFDLGTLSAEEDEAPAAVDYGCASVSATSAGARVPVKRKVRGVRQRARMLRLLPELERVQAIAVGGGTLLSDDQRDFPQILLELGRHARALGKPLLCLGCSAEGTWSARGWRMIREFLEACSVLAVREGQTAARLSATLGVTPPVFGDFCLPGTCLTVFGDYPAGRHQLAMNVSELAAPWAPEQQRLEDTLVAVAKSVAARMAPRGIGLCIFTTGLLEDERAARRVHARLEPDGARLYLPSSLEQLSALLSTASAVVASRLHGAILPLAGGVPVVGVGGSGRLRSFFSTMNMGRYCYEPESSAQLADWLALVDLGIVLRDQKRALAYSAVGRTRTSMRARIASLVASGLDDSRTEAEACPRHVRDSSDRRGAIPGSRVCADRVR